MSLSELARARFGCGTSVAGVGLADVGPLGARGSVAEMAAARFSAAVELRPLVQSPVIATPGGGASRPIPGGVVTAAEGSSRPIPSERSVVNARGGSRKEKDTETGAPAARPFEGALEEADAERRKQAELLLPLLPPFCLPVAGGKGSSLPRLQYEEAAIRMLVNTGGKASDTLKYIRLFITDYREFRQVGAKVSVFPIESADALACRDWLRREGRPHAADRVPLAMKTASELSIPVTFVERSFVERRGAKEKRSQRAREAPPPLFVTRLAAAACEPAPGTSPPLVQKHREMYVDMVGASRGGGFHNSYLIPPSPGVADRPEGAFHLVCREDKLGREDVHQWVPMTDVRSGEPLGPWASEFVAARERGDKGFLISDWADASSKEKNVTQSLAVAMRGGKLVYAPKRRALASFTDAMPSAVGMTLEELRERRLTGTHLYRHLAGEVTEEIEWPEEEANVVGDWTDAKRDEAGGFSDPAPKPKRRSGTRKRYYAPNASRGKQIRVRTRFFGAIAAGLARFGIANLTDATSWADIFPKPPPAELMPFYGPAGA